MNNIDFQAIEQTVKAMTQDPSLGMKKWNANITWKDGVQNNLTIRDFSPIPIDEPATLGGKDLAPNPVEYLIGAAASCFAITFEVLASQSGINLESLDVEIEADLNAAVFLGLTKGNGGILAPKMSLTAKTSATEEEINKVVDLAMSKSPVLLSLNSKIDISIMK